MRANPETMGGRLLMMADHVVNTCDRLITVNEKGDHVRWIGAGPVRLSVDAELQAHTSKSYRPLRVKLATLAIEDPDGKCSVMVKREWRHDSIRDDPYNQFILDTFREHYHESEGGKPLYVRSIDPGSLSVIMKVPTHLAIPYGESEQTA